MIATTGTGLGTRKSDKRASASKRAFPNPESRIPNPESRIPNPESRVPSPESRVPSPESRLDEHLPGKDLDFAAYTRKMREHGLKTARHRRQTRLPAWTMPVAQPKFGKFYDADGKLVADHANPPPERLDPQHNSLQSFYKTQPILVQLSNVDENNPAALEYFVGAYEHGIDQGADAFRIHAVGLTPVTYWKKFSARTRVRDSRS